MPLPLKAPLAFLINVEIEEASAPLTYALNLNDRKCAVLRGNARVHRLELSRPRSQALPPPRVLRVTFDLPARKAEGGPGT